ncbi:MAG: type I-C CRISPR-associated protein Cas5c [Bryobacteraceae bacterium]
MSNIASFSVRIQGEYGCFTRPEFKTERVSYEVPTPSAVRGVLEAVLWKPAIRWEIRRILMLREPRLIQFKRNEVNKKLSTDSARSAMKAGTSLDYFADEDRSQRNTVALANLDFAVEAEMHWTARRGAADNEQKFIEMFERRLIKGQYHMQPYLGCREFPAVVEPYSGDPKPIERTQDLGVMLHDIAFSPTGNRAVFFLAQLERGVIQVPAWNAGAAQ